MTTKPHPDESRFSTLSRLQQDMKALVEGQLRLEAHMVNLAQANGVTRQMLEEERAALREQFRPLATVPRSPFAPFG